MDSNLSIAAKINGNFTKKKFFTRFIKGRLTFSKKGQVYFEIFDGQESFRIRPFTKSNAWGLFPAGKSIFKKGDFINCYTSTGIN
jgi:molybdopterin molybdotransferase